MTKPYVRPDVAAFLAAGRESGAPAINELPVPEARAAIRAMGQALDLPRNRWRWCGIWPAARSRSGYMMRARHAIQVR